MYLLRGTNWVFISQKTTFFIVTAVKTSYLTKLFWFFIGFRVYEKQLTNAPTGNFPGSDGSQK
jgi:hypothetical protein